jgi:5-hydroxyisourate hydrolase-like protein (transthyretin family)
VIEVLSGQPIAGVTVAYRLEGSRYWRSSLETDADGRFSLASMPAGTFEVSTSRPGYVDGLYGRRRPYGPGQTIELSDGAEVTGLDIPIWKEATVSGRVVGAAGQPIAGATVRLMRLTSQMGTRYLEESRSAATDLAGRYEVRVPPSTYAVAVTTTAVEPERGSGAAYLFIGYPTTYYPDSPHADGASLVVLNSGEERRDINFTRAAISMVSVAGSVVGLPRAALELQVELVPSRLSKVVTPLSSVTAAVGPTGQFRFPRVTAGTYLLRTTSFPLARYSSSTAWIAQRVSGMDFSFTIARFHEGRPVTPLPTTPTLWADLPVIVGSRDIAGLALTLKTGAQISGRVEFPRRLGRCQAGRYDLRLSDRSHRVDQWRGARGAPVSRRTIHRLWFAARRVLRGRCDRRAAGTLERASVSGRAG